MPSEPSQTGFPCATAAVPEKPDPGDEGPAGAAFLFLFPVSVAGALAPNSPKLLNLGLPPWALLDDKGPRRQTPSKQGATGSAWGDGVHASA